MRILEINNLYPNAGGEMCILKLGKIAYLHYFL